MCPGWRQTEVLKAEDGAGLHQDNVSKDEGVGYDKDLGGSICEIIEIERIQDKEEEPTVTTGFLVWTPEMCVPFTVGEQV